MSTNESTSAKRPRVLCIDDDPQITQALQVRMRDWGFDVVAANYGMQGITRAATERPDVIVTDLRMPQGAGDYVVQRLRDDPRTCKIPVIVLTGCRDAHFEMQMRGLNVRAYFTKPASFEALRSAICKALPADLATLADAPAVAVA